MPVRDDVPLLREYGAEGPAPHLGRPGQDFCTTRSSERDNLGTSLSPEPCGSAQGWGAIPRGPSSSLQMKGLGMIVVGVTRVSSTVVATEGDHER